MDLVFINKKFDDEINFCNINENLKHDLELFLIESCVNVLKRSIILVKRTAL